MHFNLSLLGVNYGSWSDLVSDSTNAHLIVLYTGAVETHTHFLVYKDPNFGRGGRKFKKEGFKKRERRFPFS
jgi:hypothetical protein